MGANRDLLVLANQAHLSKEELDKQLAALNTILFPVENWNAFCTANDQDKLVNAILRIQKKLGGLETKNAVNFLLEKDIHRCFAILLKYYDKLYINGLLRRENPEMQVRKIPCSSTNPRDNATAILHIIPTPSIP